jgi:2-phosphosulfolactate phosphatase
MKPRVELLLTPAELACLKPQTLEETTCVVFDVLRATSTMAVALGHGAREIIVVSEIAEALALHANHPDRLLAGEREGNRITSELTGSIDFDLGNSPREFTPERVAQRAIVMTTTNGTRALRGCEGAHSILAASFVNLGATANLLRESAAARVLVVCAGTGEKTATEDVLGAGALISLLTEAGFDTGTDACDMATHLFHTLDTTLEAAFARTVNGRRLAADPGLHGDLAICAQRDVVSKPVQVLGNVATLVA